MAYIGKQPVVGNFQVCDAISVVNGQAAYTMQVGSANVEPENANHMLVSLNGILQKPGSSFTISGSTITFASNLATGDVIDFIILLGDTLNVGTPSDDSVGAAQIKNDLISGTTALASEPDDTDEFLVSDAGTLKRIDYSLIKSDSTHVKIATADYSSGVSSFTFTDCFTSTYSLYKVYVYDIAIATDVNNELRAYFQNSSNNDVDGWGAAAQGYFITDDGGSAGEGNEAGGVSDHIRMGHDDFDETANQVSALEMTIFQPYESTNTLVSYQLQLRADNSRFYSIYGGARLNVNTSLENLKFQTSAGANFQSYKSVIYGIKR